MGNVVSSFYGISINSCVRSWFWAPPNLFPKNLAMPLILWLSHIHSKVDSHKNSLTSDDLTFKPHFVKWSAFLATVNEPLTVKSILALTHVFWHAKICLIVPPINKCRWGFSVTEILSRHMNFLHAKTAILSPPSQNRKKSQSGILISFLGPRRSI